MLRKIKDICQNAELTTYNKANVTVTVEQGAFVPASCSKTGQDAQCLAERRKSSMFERNELDKNQASLKQMRKKAQKAFERWEESLLKQISAANDNIQFDSAEFRTAYIYLSNLKFKFLQAKCTMKFKGGQCGEINSFALKQIVEEASNHEEKLNIRGITLTNKAQNNNHYFLLISNNLPAKLTITGHAEIKKFFAAHKNAYLCDPWNKGLFKKIYVDTSGLYFSNTEWHEATIEDYAPPTDIIAKLPKPTQQIFYKELSNLGVMQAFNLVVEEEKKAEASVNIPAVSTTDTKLGFFDRAIQHVGNYAQQLVAECPAYFPGTDSVMHSRFWNQSHTINPLDQQNNQCAASLKIGP